MASVDEAAAFSSNNDPAMKVADNTQEEESTTMSETNSIVSESATGESALDKTHISNADGAPMQLDAEDHSEDSESATLDLSSTNKENNDTTAPARTTINRVSLTAATFESPSTNTNTNTPPLETPRRLTQATTGLSELSKQLRVLQAKNQHLHSEMERCQRQLKIMSESKGVSVVDVLASLENACAREASAELKSQISSLQAQLEALQVSSSNSGDKSCGKAAALQTESFQQQIAALELQVGAAEEMETKLKQETKLLYEKVQSHQTAALTFEAQCQRQSSELDEVRSKVATLEAELVSMKEERDALKARETKRMAQKWQHTLEQTEDVEDPRALLEKVELFQPAIQGEAMQSTSTQKYGYTPSIGLPNDMEAADTNREVADVNASDKPTNYAPSKLPKYRPTLLRSMSDPAICGSELDAKVSTVPVQVSSMLPRYSSIHKQWQWIYDADDSHRSNLYVKQSAKNMELEALCRHQQQTLEELQKDQSRDEVTWNRLEMERNAAHTKRNVFEQEVKKLELDLRLEKEQTASLQNQLERREEEHSLKKDQLQSRLKVHQERIHDVEGQLSSLYVAFELLQQDRSEEQTQQAELRIRLVDADSKVAAHMSSERPAVPLQDDEELARRLSQTSAVAVDTSVANSPALDSDRVVTTPRAGLFTPSPRGGSVRNLFSRSSANSSNLPAGLPLSASSRGTSETPPGLPSPPSLQKGRRASTKSAAKVPPPPGTTICKGYLLQQQQGKKKLLRGESPPSWKSKYMVLKEGEGSTGAGSYALYYGEVPQGKVKGVISHLIRGISAVKFHGSFGTDATNTTDAVKPHSFTLFINPRDPSAPVINLAAYSSIELQPWKVILEETLGVSYHDLSESDQQRASSRMAEAMAKQYA